MKLILFVLSLCVLSCNNSETHTAKSAPTNAKVNTVMTSANNYKLDVYDYNGLAPLINKKDDQVHVVNFWATWCAPCVKELPYFEVINTQYKNEGVEVLLVSLDFPKDYETKLKSFILKHNITSKVVALDDTDQNRWITAIDQSWSGALPATIIYKGDKRNFYEQSFTQKELETELKQFLK
ncbi:redoxin domain-containing protein [Winogradskyella sp.]|nr:redoxin domain-containing protein [Winogradskyella sp.]